MSCNDLKPPTPPTLQNIPGNVNLPQGMNPDSVKNMASGGGLSGAMKNVSGMVSDGLKKLGAGFSPAAIGAKVDSLVGGISNTITSTVQGAVGGISNLKNRISSFSPSDQLSNLSGAPGAAMTQVRGKLDGVSEFSDLESKVAGGKCAKNYINQAGKVNSNMRKDAASAAAKISKKDRLRMARDPAVKAQKEKEVTDHVTEQTKKRALVEANTPEKETKTVQTSLQSDTLDVQSVKSTPPFMKYIDSYITKFQPGWDENVGTWPKFSEYITPLIDSYISSIGTSGKKPDTITTDKHIHIDDLEWRDESVNIDLYSYSVADHLAMWSKEMGRKDETDQTWEESDQFVTPKYFMMSFVTETLGIKEDIINGLPTVTTQTTIRLTHTVNVGEHPIYGNWSQSTITTPIVRGEAETPLEAYKDSVKYSIDHNTTQNKLITLIN